MLRCSKSRGYRVSTYGLVCSSFFWFNQLSLKVFITDPQKGTTMEAIATVAVFKV